MNSTWGMAVLVLALASGDAFAQSRDSLKPTQPKAIEISTGPGAVFIRGGPGDPYPILGEVKWNYKLAGGQRYVSTGTMNGWHRIWWDGSEGWVKSIYAKPLYGVYVARVTKPIANVEWWLTGQLPKIVGQVYHGQMYALTGSYTICIGNINYSWIPWKGGKYRILNVDIEWVLL